MKIADLGLAVQFEDALTAKSGTPGYMAPEILRDEDYTEVVDIFSLGVVFFNILTCMYLFKGKTWKDTLQFNKACDLSILDPYLDRLSISCKDLVLKMLAADPCSRPSASVALNHPWFKEDQNAIRVLLRVNSEVCDLDPKVRLKSIVHRNKKSQSPKSRFDQMDITSNKSANDLSNQR